MQEVAHFGREDCIVWRMCRYYFPKCIANCLCLPVGLELNECTLEDFGIHDMLVPREVDRTGSLVSCKGVQVLGLVYMTSFHKSNQKRTVDPLPILHLAIP